MNQLRVILAVGGAAVLGVGAVLGGIGWTISAERSRWPALSETAPFHADALPPLPDPAAGEQAWAQLSVAIQAYTASADGADLRDVLQGEGRPALDQLGAWRGQAAGLRQLDVFLAETEGLVIPQPEHFDDPLPDLLPVQELARLWLVKAWADAEDEEVALAAEQMLKVCRLGERMMEGDSGLVGVMVGVAVYRMGARELRELVSAHEAGALDLAASGLTVPDRGGVARALVAEAELMEALLADPDQAMAGAEATGLSSLTYDPELTQVWYRQQMQPMIDAAAQPRWEREDVEFALPEAGSALGEKLVNPVGRILLSIVTPNYAGMVEREDTARAEGRVLQLWLAARQRARDQEGALPAGQGALVPDYLTAPVLDPFDGEALGIDADAVWSRGAEELDEGTAEGLRLSLQ